MTLRELLNHLRHNVLRDEAEPHLWDDAQLTMYLNQAEGLFARATHCLMADEGAVAEIMLQPEQRSYPLDPKVIAVVEAYDDLGVRLRDLSRGKMRGGMHIGRPNAYSTDAAVRTLRVTPTPDAEYMLHLVVAHRPLTPMVQDADTPAIPDEYHLHLCDYVAYMALRNNDPEQTEMVSSEVFRDSWQEVVREAKRELQLRKAGANPRAQQAWTDKIQR